jgi:predicted ATP-dependent serine protease
MSPLWLVGMKSHKQISLCEQHYNIANNNLQIVANMDILKVLTIVEKVIVRFKVKI